MPDQQVDYTQAEALGVSREAYDEVLDIVGRTPTVDELSTLLAMWDQNGRKQSLFSWLKGQHHTVKRNEYIYNGNADHTTLGEPRIKDCLAFAKRLCQTINHTPTNLSLKTGMLLYMVGNVSSEFADSEYARKCLHLVDSPMATAGHAEDCQYIEMILSAMLGNNMFSTFTSIGSGGLFCSLLSTTVPLGFDILTPREVRLDAFLFGEESGRYLVALYEESDDQFLLKLNEARLNCCFLGRTTKGRIVVDGYDFGPIKQYLIG